MWITWKTRTAALPSGGALGLAACWRLDDAVLDRVDRGLRARRDVELAEDAADVVLHRLLAQEQLLRDLLVRQAERDQPDDVGLALRQFRRVAAITTRAQTAEHVAGKTRVDVDIAGVDHQQ